MARGWASWRRACGTTHRRARSAAESFSLARGTRGRRTSPSSRGCASRASRRCTRRWRRRRWRSGYKSSPPSSTRRTGSGRRPPSGTCRRTWTWTSFSAGRGGGGERLLRLRLGHRRAELVGDELGVDGLVVHDEPVEDRACRCPGVCGRARGRRNQGRGRRRCCRCGGLGCRRGRGSGGRSGGRSGGLWLVRSGLWRLGRRLLLLGWRV
mmetsp:Transcript_49800/g.153195  ORF Transcript_49800/g.153195 Transcript_49800/m.153195 type:complete len:210 (+) Transcript_49800:857-1486(+)